MHLHWENEYNPQQFQCPVAQATHFCLLAMIKKKNYKNKYSLAFQPFSRSYPNMGKNSRELKMISILCWKMFEYYIFFKSLNVLRGFSTYCTITFSLPSLSVSGHPKSAHPFKDECKSYAN